MSTARDLISGSLRLIGVLASGEALPADSAADALSVLNDLIDSWSNEKLLIPSRAREVFALTSGQGAYTMGSGGDFNTSRPQKIETALVQVAGANSLELPIDIVTEEQFAAISLKSLSTIYPAYLYAEGTSPLEKVNLWPVPSGGNNLVLYSSKPLANIGTLSTSFSVPNGYLRALRFALAVELAPEYGRAPREDVIALATQSKGVIKRMNSRPVYLSCDNALLSRGSVGGSSFNILSGGAPDDSDSIVDGGTD